MIECGANLRQAYLRRANLFRANLTGAVLSEAVYNNDNQWPDDFDPEVAGAKKAD